MAKFPCRKRKGGVQPRTREIIASLFARGKTDTAFRHRLAQCFHATACGRLCGYIDKEPGEDPRCTNLATGTSVLLYDALEREDFRCPEGLF